MFHGDDERVDVDVAPAQHRHVGGPVEGPARRLSRQPSTRKVSIIWSASAPASDAAC